MSKDEHKKQTDGGGKTRFLSRRKVMIISSVGAVVAIVAALVLVVLFYDHKVLPNIYAAGVHLSAKSLDEADDLLQTKADAISQQSVTLSAKDQKVEIHPSDITLVIDTKSTAGNAYAYGRRTDFWTSLKEAVGSLTSKNNLAFIISYDDTQLTKIVDDFAAKVDQPEINAGVKIDNGVAVETEGVSGKRIDKNVAKAAVINAWQNAVAGEVGLSLNTVEPVIKTGATKEVLAQAETLRKVKFVVTADSRSVTAKQADVDKWISSDLYQGKLIAAVDVNAVKLWLDTVSDVFKQQGNEARVGFSGGALTIINPGSDTRALDSQKTAAALHKAVEDYVVNGKSDKTVTVAGTMLVNQPQVTNDTLSTLGIKELIGTGTTSFTGSPENRKHNIAIGASALSGILVKPGEEFSTLKNLGKIDNTNGYLPELVIKVDKTVPEFGGGLCQVSTTLFRATMNSGLKVTARQNHSYRVAYYEPPVGMDATIYEGNPDYRFVNDTGHYILIQSHIEGVKITFDIYGTKDGRTANSTNPVVYNVVPPPDPEYVRTDTLPYGTTKQTDKAHNGSDATFTYTVLNADGTTRNKQTFNSHYVPWKARYLVGTAGAPAEATYPGSTPSPSPSPTPTP